MSETVTQVNYDAAGHRTAGRYSDPAFQVAIEASNGQREVSEVAFQSVVDTESLNDSYTQPIADTQAYFASRGLSISPVRVITEATMGKAYKAANERPSQDAESGQGRNIHGRAVVVENLPLQDVFGDAYVLGISLHEAAHSLSKNRMMRKTQEVVGFDAGGELQSRVVLGGVATSGLIKADLRQNRTKNMKGDFWEEAFADLSRVRGLRYLQKSHAMKGDSKSVVMEGVNVTVLPSHVSSAQPESTRSSAVIPAEFATLAQTTAEGRNQIAVGAPNLAAYALELLDTRVPGLYDDMEAGTQDSKRQAQAIRKIESVKPGLYSQLRELEYTGQDFAEGLQIVVDALNARTVSVTPQYAASGK